MILHDINISRLGSRVLEIAANVIHETRKRAEDYDQLLDQHSTAVAQTTDSIKLNGLSGYFLCFTCPFLCCIVCHILYICFFMKRNEICITF